jgi:exosortase/archaeosortase family protein
MRLNVLFKNRKAFFLLIAGIFFIIIFLTVRFFNPEFISILLGPYYSIAESLANYILKLLVDGTDIQNHKIIFTYYPKYFRWFAILLLSFWFAHSSLKKKVKFTFLLLLTHCFAVVIGLVKIGIHPMFENSVFLSQLQPNAIGDIAMFSLFAVWLKHSISDIQIALEEIRFNFKLTEKRMNEILVVFFLYILLTDFLIPYLNFQYYIDLILKAVKLMVFVFGYLGEINGIQMSGSNGGTLIVDSSCLGFHTMFIFAAMVYLTRRENKTSWKYILFGILLLHIVNILRLSLIFIFVQHNSDNELIHAYHDILSIVVYLLIFVSWIIWFEKFNKIGKDI